MTCNSESSHTKRFNFEIHDANIYLDFLVVVLHTIMQPYIQYFLVIDNLLKPVGVRNINIIQFIPVIEPYQLSSDLLISLCQIRAQCEQQQKNKKRTAVDGIHRIVSFRPFRFVTKAN